MEFYFITLFKKSGKFTKNLKKLRKIYYQKFVKPHFIALFKKFPNLQKFRKNL